jgi:hypothetical protein
MLEYACFVGKVCKRSFMKIFPHTCQELAASGLNSILEIVLCHRYRLKDFNDSLQVKLGVKLFLSCHFSQVIKEGDFI